MPSIAKVLSPKIKSILSHFKFNKAPMAENEEVKPTDVFNHRYQNPEVLRNFLMEELGFENKDIIITVSSNVSGTIFAMYFMLTTEHG